MPEVPPNDSRRRARSERGSALRAADGHLSPAEVQRALGARLAHTTVATILSRLYAKGWVSRIRSGRGFAYTPTKDSPGLTARRMPHGAGEEEDRSTVLARFVSCS